MSLWKTKEFKSIMRSQMLCLPSIMNGINKPLDLRFSTGFDDGTWFMVVEPTNNYKVNRSYFSPLPSPHPRQVLHPCVCKLSTLPLLPSSLYVCFNSDSSEVSIVRDARRSDATKQNQSSSDYSLDKKSWAENARRCSQKWKRGTRFRGSRIHTTIAECTSFQCENALCKISHNETKCSNGEKNENIRKKNMKRMNARNANRSRMPVARTLTNWMNAAECVNGNYVNIKWKIAENFPHVFHTSIRLSMQWAWVPPVSSAGNSHHIV